MLNSYEKPTGYANKNICFDTVLTYSTLFILISFHEYVYFNMLHLTILIFTLSMYQNSYTVYFILKDNDSFEAPSLKCYVN